ncbi:hypothetical protein [Tenacibaculum jejuense]|uniref:Uncharacterized protein n=1 Tax=Tenacibaculum jejuense TaxID=584609 RepID=A0A238U7Q0_9FLAO|nr:hypothetical protein [Tenacibaculum jejuense]SNR15177.1 protein of unknown function [Tenacibaculum jejuense]
MKKSILSLGKTLGKSEQKNVFGGKTIVITPRGPGPGALSNPKKPECYSDSDCDQHYHCYGSVCLFTAEKEF